MPNLIIHIGVPKTGTTAIQHAVYNHRKSLLSEGILYPSDGLWTDKSHNEFGLSALGHESYGERKIPAFALITDKILREIAENNHVDTVLISSEALQGIAWKESVYNLQTFFKNFSKVSIICCVRRQDHLIDSLFKQNVKDPATACAEYAEDYISLRKNWFRFDRLKKQWLTLPEVSKFECYPYLSAQKNVNNHGFFTALTILSKNLKFIPEVRGEKNKSLDGIALENVWHLNRYGSETSSKKDLSLKSHMPVTLFSPKSRAQFLKSHFSGNVEIFNSYRHYDWGQMYHEDKITREIQLR